MKNINKRDLLNISILTILFLVFVAILVGTEFLYGSNVDWRSQHVAIPEYFRTLFYDTYQIFPDFAFNIGAGQNIYNLAYYGLLSPFILFSYLLPFVNMTYYLMTIAILIVISSTILLYKFLKSNGFTTNVTFLSSFLFMFSTSLSLHSHRHIMFVFYMPFLILGLFGVDKYFEKGKRSLLIISIFLMIMTSFYYSIAGLICIGVYGVYKYLKNNEKIELKKFIKDITLLIIPMFIGVILSLVLIMPVFYTLLLNRGETNVIITLKELINPKIHLNYILYRSYGIGLTIISVIAIISLFFYKKRENIFLGIFVTLILLFPVFNYILNGTMYIDAKIFIPLLPLCILIIAIFIENLFKNKLNIKKLGLAIIFVLLISIYRGTLNIELGGALLDVIFTILFILIYYKTKKEYHLILPLMIFTFLITLGINKEDDLVLREDFLGTDTKIINRLINEITASDDTFYRISITNDKLMNINRNFNNINFYSATIYSSVSNRYYNKFYYDIINNPIQMRNRAITAANYNLLSNIFLGNKYIISKNTVAPLGYKLYKEYNDIFVYKNENVLPIAYASSFTLPKRKWRELKYPNNITALITNIIHPDSSFVYMRNNNDFEFAKKLDVNFNELDTKNLNITYDNDKIIIEANEPTFLNFNLPDEYKNHILLINFDMLYSQSCKKGDTEIIINNIRNVLTCSSWKYHNENYNFSYQIGLTDNTDIAIKIGRGRYVIRNIELYIIDYENIRNVRDSVDEFIFDREKTKGNVIEGHINVTNAGYFTISIPYDKGFRIYLNGEEIPYEKVNTSFIGFKINPGKHHIRIVYNAPYKRAGMFGSGIGLLMFIGVIIYEKKHLKNKFISKHSY